MSSQYGDSTRSLHAGMPAPVPGAPMLPGPVFAAPYHLDPAGWTPGTDGYGRGDNPTRRLLEDAIGELEGGGCLAFASGQAAITALLMTVLRPGDTVMIPSDGYYNVRSFAASTLAGLGITTVEAPTAGPYPSFEGVRLVLLETPANPGLDLVDIAAVARAAHAAGALVAVDNTTATPLSQRPLELGADVVVASGTKALAGHSDMLLGYTATNDAELLDGMRQWRTLAGAVPSPFDCWLARRSMGTLALRLRQQSANAAAAVKLLREHPLADAVRWAGDSELAARQMRIIPGLVSFELPSAEHVAAFLRASALVMAATSFGGLHSSADRRHQWGDSVAPGFVRLSCGIEDTDDLLADLTKSLDAAG
ncbi:cystathionine gamma-lyase [Catellatospora sp. IY07-71]|uniref:cystathionine gamma-lyase n=1 Tax=Catellatospora sp. IY07-71 TaxID=2728827 RepID=UPI001BB30A13|nr:cystathionine gamma-lyase [Catellatospora sp. IY07-71]